MEFAEVGAVNFALEAENLALDWDNLAPHIANSSSELRSLADDFVEELTSTTEHFFIVVDPRDKIAVDEIIAIDPTIENPKSITTFLMFPIAAPGAMSRRRDSIIDITKYVMLTSNEYVIVVLEVRWTRLALAVEKERN